MILGNPIHVYLLSTVSDEIWGKANTKLSKSTRTFLRYNMTIAKSSVNRKVTFNLKI